MTEIIPEAQILSLQPRPPVKKHRPLTYRLDIGLYPVEENLTAQDWQEFPKPLHNLNEIQAAIGELLTLYYRQDSEIAIRLRRHKRRD